MNGFGTMLRCLAFLLVASMTAVCALPAANAQTGARPPAAVELERGVPLGPAAPAGAEAIQRRQHRPLPESDRLLLAAARDGDAQSMLALFAKGANAGARDDLGNGTALLAVRSRSTSALRVALANGADPNAVGSGGMTPLIAAAMAGDLAMVRYLRAAGANLELRGGTGSPPLHLAASLDRVEVVRDLLEAGADPLAYDRLGRHVLGVAASSGALRTIEYLIESGMDVHLPGREYITPIQWALRFRRKQAVELFLAYGADPGVMSAEIFRDPLVELPPRRPQTPAPPPSPFRS